MSDFNNLQEDKALGISSCYRFVALYKNRKVASARLSKREDSPYPGYWVSDLYVRIRFRGAGIDEKLMQKVIRFIKDRDIPFFYLNVDDTDVKTLNSYKRLGFKELASTTSESFSGQMSLRQIIMRMDLSAFVENRGFARACPLRRCFSEASTPKWRYGTQACLHAEVRFGTQAWMNAKKMSAFVKTSERPHRSLGEGGLRRNLAETLVKADFAGIPPEPWRRRTRIGNG